MKRKIGLIISLIVSMLIIGSTMVFAATKIPVIGDPNLPPAATDTMSSVLGIISYVGVFAAIAILIVFGVKYMMASASEKGDMKGKLLYYVMGALFVAGAPFLVKLIVGIADNLK